MLWARRIEGDRVPGLCVRGLVWRGANGRHRLEPDPLDVPPGASAGVVAPGPAGRALADVLTGAVAAPAGEVLAAGAPVRSGAVALVPPGGAVLPHLTVEANVAYGPAYGRGHRRDEVLPAARLLQVDSLLGLPAGRLSPAQRLRVGLARAVAARPAAIVVEDRDGGPPCAAAVTALTAAGFAVVVVTDDPARLPAEAVVHRAVPAAAGTHRTAAGSGDAPGDGRVGS